MISQYQGPWAYNQASISTNAPDVKGVYYCGYISPKNTLATLYVGKSEEDSIKNRLLNHLNQDNWTDVTHFGFKTGETNQEISNFEQQEIVRLNPKYNQKVG